MRESDWGKCTLKWDGPFLFFSEAHIVIYDLFAISSVQSNSGFACNVKLAYLLVDSW